MVKKSASINLVKIDRNETLNQIINWMLGAGRVLIIVVELIALLAFLYRFILDSQLRDLHSKIKQEQAIIGAQKNNETLYRNLQERLSLASSVYDNASTNKKIFEDIIGFAPIGMTFANISFTKDSVKVTASVNSVYPLSSFVESVKNYPKVDSVSIDKIENKTSNALINVSLTIFLKKEATVR